AAWPSMPSVVIQEYLPRDRAEDWIVHAYIGRDRDAELVFTGLKLRSWPPHAGATAVAVSRANPELAELALSFIRAISFRGICDMDWRLATTSGRYSLLDFNPRLGANFRMFETSAGVDVARAL